MFDAFSIYSLSDDNNNDGIYPFNIYTAYLLTLILI